MASSERRGRERGAALIATLLVSALLMIIGSIASQQAVVSWLIGHRLRESAEALVTAETGIAMVIADFESEPRFGRLDLPDGSPFPFLQVPAGVPLPTSFRVRTEIRARSAGRVDLIAIATGRNRARRVVAVTVERTAEPYVPAAFFVGGAGSSLSVAGDLTIAGSAAAAGAIPALGAPADTQAESLRDRLEADGAVVRGGTVGSPWSELDETLTRVRAGAQLLHDSPVGDLARGIWESRGSVEVSRASLAGVWLVDGDLSIRSSLSFEGLLLVLGDINIGPGADFQINGALALLPPGRSFQSRGDAVISYRAGPLRDVESLDPTLLGRRARLIGWRDGG